MSGIAGIVNRDDSPADEAIVRKMTDFLAFRGPDAQTVWVGGQAGLGHTLFRTTPDEIDEQQPCTLDGRIWITADARLDDREGLRRRLAERDVPCAGNCSGRQADSGCLSRLGRTMSRLFGRRFRFAIWDQRKTPAVLCPRSVRRPPILLLLSMPNSLVFSNTLACLRLHPERRLVSWTNGSWATGFCREGAVNPIPRHSGASVGCRRHTS